MVFTILRARVVIATVLTLCSGVANAERTLQSTSWRVFTAPYAGAATDHSSSPPEGCNSPELCRSQGFADATTGAVGCWSEVARITTSTPLITKGWGGFEQTFEVPKHTRSVKIETTWHAQGASEAKGGAAANAWVNVQVFKGDTPIKDSGGTGVGLFVYGLSPLQVQAVNQEVKPLPFYLHFDPKDRLPMTLRLKARMNCDATAGTTFADATIPGGARVETYHYPAAPAQGSRLKQIRVEFYR